MKREAMREGLLLAGALLLIAAVFMSGALNMQKTWTSLDLTYRDDRTAFDTANGDAYGAVTQGPYFDLPAGRYRIKWQIEGDGENLIRLACSNGVVITPDVLRTTPGGWEGEGFFELPDTAHSFQVNVEFAAGSFIKIHNFRLYSNTRTARIRLRLR